MRPHSATSFGLALLLVSVALKGFLLAWLVPAWQQPDEPAHFQYTQLMVEEHRLPVSAGSTLYLSPEVVRSVLAHGLAINLPIAVKTQLSTDGLPTQAPDHEVFGAVPANPAAQYGPLYYALVAVPYDLLRDAPVEHRLIAMRLVSVFLFLGVVLAAYGIAFTLRPRPGFALAVATTVGWLPMPSYVFAGVNNDALAILLGALAFWLLLHLWTRRLTAPHLVLIVALCTVGTLTKMPLIIFLPLFAFVMLRKRSGLTLAARSVALIALVVLPIGSTLLWQHSVTVSNLPGLTPILPTWTKPALTVGWFLYDTFFYRPAIVWTSFWGNFGWLSYPLHAGVYALTVLLGGAAVVGLIQLCRDLRRGIARTITREVLSLLLASYVLLEGLYLALFWGTLLVYNNPNFPNQGRYYFIILVPLVVLGFLGLERFVPQRLHRFGAWGLATLLLVLNLDTLVVMLRAWA